jgi:hypothetical protein
MASVYAEWKSRGAEFLTEPKQHTHEIRCYMRDPNAHLIEVGQVTDPLTAARGPSLGGQLSLPPTLGDTNIGPSELLNR